MSKTTCGVKVSTWGSHYGAGNGMLDFLDTSLFGGNVGHASITLTIPVNSASEELLKKYCTDPKIPYQKKTVSVQGTTFNEETGKLEKSDAPAFEEAVYEVYFSWWPSPKDSREKYALVERANVDNLKEWEGVNFDWKPDEGINPFIRHYPTSLGVQTMTFGPLVISHQRNLSDEMMAQINYNILQTTIDKHLESLERLLEKIEKLEKIELKKIEKKKDQEIYEIKLGPNEENTLNRSVPNWKDDIKNIKKISKEEIINLRDKTLTLKTKYSSIADEALERNYILELQKQISSQPSDIKKAMTDFMATNLKAHLGLLNNRKYAKFINNYITENISGYQLPTLDTNSIAKFKNYLDARKQQIETDIKHFAPGVTLPKESFDIIEERQAIDDLHVTIGKPADNIVHLPLSNETFPDRHGGHEFGLDVESMLKAMQTLSSPEAPGFDLRTKNCSKTVDFILEAGATKPHLKNIFKNKALGFYGNPQEAYNNSLNFQSAIYNGEGNSPSLIRRLANLNFIEKAGGYLIGIWEHNNGPLNFKKILNRSAALLPLVFIVGPLSFAVYSIKKIINPLNTFKDILNLINYITSKTLNKKAKVLAGIILFASGSALVVFGIPAATQYIISNLITSPLKKLFRSKKEENPNHIQESVDNALKDIGDKKTYTINTDPINALKEADYLLSRSTNILPVFSSKTLKQLEKFDRDYGGEKLDIELGGNNINTYHSAYTTVLDKIEQRKAQVQKSQTTDLQSEVPDLRQDPNKTLTRKN